MSKRSTWRTALIILVTAILTTAILKNPSKAEANQLIKETVIQHVRNNMSEHLSDFDQSKGDEIAAALIIDTLFPKLMDYVLDINVSDYVVFSTFKVSTRFNNDVNSSREFSGFILFGKVFGLPQS